VDEGEVADLCYEQNEHEWFTEVFGEVFGCENEGPAAQDVGSIITKEGRLVTFPNIFQHRVEPFELEDKTKPGHRKFLVMFLVDPNIKIISSANVPCQQRAWWGEEMQTSKIFAKLPNEMVKEIVDHVEEFPISLEEAKELRLELMEERKAFVEEHDDAHQATFSLCEH
jgi:predicted RNA-binding protein YlqC (UPF0109 family)